MSGHMQFEHIDSVKGGEFYLTDADQSRIAEISYRYQTPQIIIADHTWVDDRLRGQGTAKLLLDRLVEFARTEKLKIVPTCSYVVVMFKRFHNEYHDVIA